MRSYHLIKEYRKISIDRLRYVRLSHTYRRKCAKITTLTHREIEDN